MSNVVNYTDAPADVEQALDDATIISDFLPSPTELVRLVKSVEKEKVTIALDKNSLDLFKKYAKQHNTKYQPMINGILSSYADKSSQLANIFPVANINLVKSGSTLYTMSASSISTMTSSFLKPFMLFR